MAVNDDKLNKFYLAINHYAEEQRKKIEKEVNEFKNKELNETEFEVLNESYRLIQKEMAEMRNKIFREIASREMDKKKTLLIKRKQITNEVFNRAFKSLLEFTLKDNYPSLLVKYAKELSKVFDKSGTILYIKSEDKQYEDLIKQAFSIKPTIKIDDGIQIGGIKAGNSEMGIEADDTLDTKLESQREWFEKMSGMVVI